MPQETQSKSKAKKDEAAAAELFEKASRAQNEGRFLAAYDHWKTYLSQFTGMPGYNTAQYNLAFTLSHLGRPGEAIEPLRGFIQLAPPNSSLLINARLLLAECLLENKSAEEALALTFEARPQYAAPEQTIRFFIARGRAYGQLAQLDLSEKAFSDARKYLQTTKKSTLSQQDRSRIKGRLAWRQLETLELTCLSRVKPDEALSEAEFLAYADAHYGCAAPAKQLFCDVQAAGDDQIESQALLAYKRLVEAPLKLRDPLPPPARKIKKQEQREHYEQEMKALVEKTVEERSRAFRNIEACRAYDIF